MTKPRNDGFTLLEIMVVVLIIGMLMALIAPRIFSRFGQAKGDIAKMGVTQLSKQLELYKLDNGQYPTSEQGLDALVHEPTSEPRPRHYPAGGYVNPDSLKDPWQNPYNYDRPGQEQPVELRPLLVRRRRPARRRRPERGHRQLGSDGPAVSE